MISIYYNINLFKVLMIDFQKNNLFENDFNVFPTLFMNKKLHLAKFTNECR